jgi:Tfp pilus assembly protein FimT
LVEVLLVLVVISIVTAVTIPQFVRSMRGNRLRTAVRTVAMAGRYSRSMAVMRQRNMLLEFDLDNAKISVYDVTFTMPATNNLDRANGEGAGGDPQPVLTRKSLLSRRLDEVSLASVEVDDEVRREGVVPIIYSTNGRCDPYSVTVMDATGEGVTVDVDALASAETKEY